MSGLSAIIRFDASPADRGVFERCNAAAVHRGVPLEQYLDGTVAMAFLGRGPGHAQQSVGSDESGLSIVVSGSLYHKHKLALTLGENAAVTDAALLLAAYRRWGSGCLERLDGDFSFVLHDTKRNVALCARDAFGMHPLCYAFDGRQLVAASEPRQILATGVSSAPCEESIAAYLATTRHLYGGPHTFYRDIHRVEAGHVVEIDRSGARARRYWQLDPHRQIDERSDEEIAARVRELMIGAVRNRVPAVGPYACALSGGFDSSSIAALFRHVTGAGTTTSALETFSFELRDPESDEPELIDAVSGDLGSNHHHIYLDQDNVFDVLPRMLDACDEPTFDMGLLYLWRKKEEAAKHGVRVMLSGLGGDELFVGQFHFLADLLRKLRLAELWQEVQGIYPVDRYTGRRTSLQMLLRAYIVGPLVPRALKRLARRLLLGESTVPPWVDKSLAVRVGLEERIEAGPERLYADAYRQDCYEVFKTSLIDVTVPIHEALGAAFGIETRFPMLDRRLVEYMFAVPREQKIRRGEVRGVQRRAMQGFLPTAVLTRHIKKNLNPVLRRQQYQNFVTATKKLLSCNELRCEQYLNREYLRNAHQQFLSGGGGQNAALILWYAMNLEQWLRRL